MSCRFRLLEDEMMAFLLGLQYLQGCASGRSIWNVAIEIPTEQSTLIDPFPRPKNTNISSSLRSQILFYILLHCNFNFCCIFIKTISRKKSKIIKYLYTRNSVFTAFIEFCNAKVLLHCAYGTVWSGLRPKQYNWNIHLTKIFQFSPFIDLNWLFCPF